MAEVLFEAHLGFSSVRQRHAASSEPREFEDARQIQHSHSPPSTDYIFGEFEHAGSSTILASSPAVLAQPPVKDPNNSASHSLLSMLNESKLSSSQSTSSSPSNEIRAGSLSLEFPQLEESDFECSLCYRLFYQPVTTSCGHTYCKSCLSSSLRCSLDCPLCRRRLCSRQDELDLSVSYVIANVIEKHFPEQLDQRIQEERLTPSLTATPLSSSAPSQLGRNPLITEPENRQSTSVERSDRRRSSSIGWWSDCLGGCTFLYPLDL